MHAVRDSAVVNGEIESPHSLLTTIILFGLPGTMQRIPYCTIFICLPEQP
jgi:hypothetical protein